MKAKTTDLQHCPTCGGIVQIGQKCACGQVDRRHYREGEQVPRPQEVKK